MSWLCFDSDDFGATHVISDQCQSHDCRDVLVPLHRANPNFKATLFAIPNEMTIELLEWSRNNRDWIELAQHGFTHSSNYECEKMTYEDFKTWMEEEPRASLLKKYFSMGFKAPGWQISDGVYKWLKEHNYWVADQSYNDARRPMGLKAYKVGANSLHTHTWDCVGNGVYEMFDEILERVKFTNDFKFVSEVVKESK